ncbi:hypothetical protein IRB23SM22_15120 [Alkalibacterium sp. s-m-22]
MGIWVTSRGMQTTVQDKGRTGFQRYGFSVSGAMDQIAFKLEALIEEHPNHRRSAHLMRLIEAIREEGVYGEESHGVADEILEEEFETLYAEMAVELGLEEPETDGEEEPETDTNEDVDDGE